MKTDLEKRAYALGVERAREYGEMAANLASKDEDQLSGEQVAAIYFEGIESSGLDPRTASAALEYLFHLTRTT